MASKVRNVDDDHTESVDIDRFETHNQLFEVALVVSHHWDTGISYFQVIFHFKQELLVIVCGIILIESDKVDSISFLVLVWKDVESLVVYIIDDLLDMANFEWIIKVYHRLSVHVVEHSILFICDNEWRLSVIWQKELWSDV